MSRQRPLRRAETAAALLLAALAVVPDARAWDPDEARDLRVTRQAQGVRLSWQAPENGAEAYVVRRCAMASLRAWFYGTCIAEGLVAPQHDDPAPPGDVFYLVAGVVAGTEGSLGRANNGINNPLRQAEPCGPQPPATLWVKVWLNEAVELCGTRVVVRYPDGVIAFVAASCFGRTAGWAPETNALVPGEIQHACVVGEPQPGPEEADWITRLQFEQGECPIPASSLTLVLCEVSDCSGNGHAAQCYLY